MHKPVIVLANEIHKILRNFEKQIYHQIPVRKPNLV